MEIEKLKKEYATQDNRATAFPIYVSVQELVFAGVIEDGYSIGCDGAEKYEHNCDGCLKYPCTGNEDDEMPERCSEEMKCGYVWTDIEFFLTIKGAKDFIKLDKHNHGLLRTYVKHFSNRNLEMRKLLKHVGLKTND